MGEVKNWPLRRPPNGGVLGFFFSKFVKRCKKLSFGWHIRFARRKFVGNRLFFAIFLKDFTKNSEKKNAPQTEYNCASKVAPPYISQNTEALAKTRQRWPPISTKISAFCDRTWSPRVTTWTSQVGQVLTWKNASFFSYLKGKAIV